MFTNNFFKLYGWKSIQFLLLCWVTFLMYGVQLVQCADITGLFNETLCLKINDKEKECHMVYGFTLNMVSKEKFDIEVENQKLSFRAIKDYVHYDLSYVRSCYGGTPWISAYHTHKNQCIGRSWTSDFCGQKCGQMYGLQTSWYGKTYVCCLDVGGLKDFYQADIYTITASYPETELEIWYNNEAVVWNSNDGNATWNIESLDINMTKGLFSFENPSSIYKGFLVEMRDTEGKLNYTFITDHVDESFDGLCAIPSNGVGPDYSIFYKRRNEYYVKCRHGKFIPWYVGIHNLRDYTDITNLNNTKDMNDIAFTTSVNGTVVNLKLYGYNPNHIFWVVKPPYENWVPIEGIFKYDYVLNNVKSTYDQAWSEYQYNYGKTSDFVNLAVISTGQKLLMGSWPGVLNWTKQYEPQLSQNAQAKQAWCLVAQTSYYTDHNSYNYTYYFSNVFEQISGKYSEGKFYCWDHSYKKNVPIKYAIYLDQDDSFSATLEDHSLLYGIRSLASESPSELSSFFQQPSVIRKQLIVYMNYSYRITINKIRCVGPIIADLLSKKNNTYKFCFNGCNETWIINKQSQGCQLLDGCCIASNLRDGFMCLQDSYQDNCIKVEIYGYSNHTSWYNEIGQWPTVKKVGYSITTFLLLVLIIMLFMLCCCKSKLHCKCRCNCCKCQKKRRRHLATLEKKRN